MRVEGVVMHLTTTLGFIDVKGKAVQFARDAAPNIQLRDVVECEPEHRYNTWVTDVVHYVSRTSWHQAQIENDKSVVVVADGWYFWKHRRSFAPNPVDFIKVIALLQRLAGVDHLQCFFFNVDPDQWILHTKKTLADQLQRRQMVILHQKLRTNGVVVKLFGYKPYEVVLDRTPVMGLGRHGLDCAISSQLIESAVLGATDIMLLGGNGDHSSAIHTVAHALGRATWVVGFGLAVAAELKQFTRGLATYIDLTRHLEAIVLSPQPTTPLVEPQNVAVSSRSAPLEPGGEIQRGHVNKVTAKYGFITVGDRGVFFSFDLLPPGWRPSVGDEVECIPILSKQGRWKTDFIRPVHSLNAPGAGVPDPEFEVGAPALLSQKSRLSGWIEGVVKFLTSEHGFISEIVESEHQESRDVWFSLVYAPPEVGLGDSVLCIPSYNKQTKKWFTADVRLIASDAGPAASASPPATPSTPSASTLFVGSLPPNCTRREIFDTFKQFGRIASIRIVADRQYSFVNFSSPDVVHSVLQAPPIIIRGSQVSVNSYRSARRPPPTKAPVDYIPLDIFEPLTHATPEDEPLPLEWTADPDMAAQMDQLCAVLFDMGVDCSGRHEQQQINDVLMGPPCSSFDHLVSRCYEACAPPAR
eukprot:GGOE01009138.1.p1 GENE.GGOE01009138.1~~GGOE01009138.1.p1  ORF type:complete len:640 (-),score=199.57 GGOE01009138.1:287-2206(-)